MSAGMPYERRLVVPISGDPSIAAIKVPPRGHIRRIIAKQASGTDNFTLDLFSADPAVSASASLGFDIDTHRLSATLNAAAGLLSELTLDIPYALTERDEVGRIVPLMYFEIGGISGPDQLDLVAVFEIPTARA